MPDGELVGVMVGSAGRLALVLGSYVCMSSAGRPDIIQCIRCRDRGPDIAVLHGLLKSVRCLVRWLPLFSCLVLDGLTSFSDSVSYV